MKTPNRILNVIPEWVGDVIGRTLRGSTILLTIAVFWILLGSIVCGLWWLFVHHHWVIGILSAFILASFWLGNALD